MTLKSYAKVNLFLNINGKSSVNSNYHNISSIFCFAKDVYDTLKITLAENAKDEVLVKSSFKCNDIENNNIIYKTLNYVRLKGYNIPYLKIVIHKNIPIGAGLGGGSANSATLLRFLAKNFNINVSKQMLQDIAFNLGADIPACYFSSSAFVSGIGENIEPIKLPKMYLTLINPMVSKSTESFFKQIKKYSNKVQINKTYTYKELCCLIKQQDNDFKEIATLHNKEVEVILNFIKQNELFGFLSGSGLTCFTLHKTMQNAQNFSQMVNKELPNFWVKVTSVC